MNPVLKLIIFGTAMWILNFLFGLMQIKNFNNNYIEMRKRGRVAIGRKKGNFQAGTIIMLLLDEEDRVVEGRKMQGVTVFSKVKEFYGLESKKITEISEEDIKGYNKFMRLAILDAIKNFTAFKGGESGQKSEAV
ncbi:transcriptional regulator GutM [Clostridium sp. SYSU_GA19001]|uniref:transcriptional regulator GutM n=1 Tax=Clostridium caldaquaticum TaxID=2940653 RepID=UPI002077054E|nr:transcriptional regulator GutM [Clostridium caldaquaticum]MCM8710295.1 transcriptional regulator GutM [Clostridium caldaquaticum]